jgi:calcium-dependent protein kinase
MAPEVLQHHYNEKVDIWAVGVITFMLLSGKAPFCGQDDDEILEKVKIGSFEFSHHAWN